MGYRHFMLSIMAFTLVLSGLSANAQPILPNSPITAASDSTAAQGEQSEKLTLDGAVDSAMRNHPLIRAAASGRSAKSSRTATIRFLSSVLFWNRAVSGPRTSASTPLIVRVPSVISAAP
ncbi:MAG: hypothetical protein H6Q43_2063 [Deltaproteobacteria bacterium]|nr:hypothetical protein [Deltaproteobacteria bacterium]